MDFPVLHLRAETKAFERRSARIQIPDALKIDQQLTTEIVTPETTKKLINAGYTVNVERSSMRIFNDEEYEYVGASLVTEGSWVNVPQDHIIIGLKELQLEDCQFVTLVFTKHTYRV